MQKFALQYKDITKDYGYYIRYYIYIKYYLMNKKILVTGAQGLVGTDLVIALRNKYGQNNIVSFDKFINNVDSTSVKGDVTRIKNIENVIKQYSINTVFCKLRNTLCLLKRSQLCCHQS